MRFIECQSLKHLTLVKITTLLWKQNHVDNLFREKTRNKYYISDEGIGLLEENYFVLEDVKKLSLPKKLESEISCYIRPIASEIIYWKEFEGFEESNVFRYVCWTSRGTIDNKKTAEALVKDQDFDVASRYKLACSYCMERDIRALWDKMSESERIEIQIYRKGPVNEIRQFWCSVMEGKEFIFYVMNSYRPEYTLHQSLFEYAAKKGYKDAAEYFLKQLTAQEKCQSFVKTTKHVVSNMFSLMKQFKIYNKYCADVLCFLLSRIDREQQIEAIAENTFPVLCSFLEWPWQNLFVDAVNLMLDKLDNFYFQCLLNRIALKIRWHYEDYNYTELFGEIWRQSLSTHKRYVLDSKWDSVLFELWVNKDEINIKRILRDATSEEKQKLISCHFEDCVCYHFLDKEMGDTFKLFVRECIPNTNEMEKFKNDVKNHVSDVYDGFSGAMEKTLNEFLEFLDHFHDAKKRRFQDDDDDDILPSRSKVPRK